jgi:CheY-like chemotaxis protein/anti-sigma regulatory factor (Ser/Thr protein kinase)
MKPDVSLLTDIFDTKILVYTDGKRLKQVLDKLIQNAVKHTKKGSITIKVEKDDKNLTFSITDTGYGISEDKLEIIFNRFKNINYFSQGIGLGLAICKSIVDRLGGTVSLTSKLNEGSVISFTIPYRIKEDIGSVRDIAQNPRKKIMLAESSEIDLQFAKEALASKYDIVEVTDNEKIISTFIIDNPNLVLISMEMIAKTDVIGKIRAISPTLPIILMTTSDFYHDQLWAIENGCTSAIPKPFSANNIEELVMTFIV